MASHRAGHYARRLRACSVEWIGRREARDFLLRHELLGTTGNACLYFGLRDPIGNTRGFNNSEFVLRQLAVETGGRAYFPDNISDLNTVYGQIADELSNQYALGYTSKNPRRDGAWRRIIVQATRPSLTSRTKLGYFAPTNR